MNDHMVEKVWPIAKAAAEQNGCELYDVELIGPNSGRVLRVYIDNVQGVSIQNCEQVSRSLNLHLDAEDVIDGGNYNLEVSSPGLDRHLKRKNHFENVIGKEIWLKTKLKEPENTRQFTGSLLAVSDVSIELNFNGSSKIITFDNIEKAKLIYEFENKKKIKR
ncbi:MAG: ribosome maturation factor RimP [Pseudomonadota bacterium]|nr:ribosome maturation factor RimP [Pseudomonadota bacterium]